MSDNATFLRSALPGLLPLFLIALFASLLPLIQPMAPALLARLPLSPILIGILLGMALAPMARRRPQWSAGIKLAAGPWLKFAVVLIGLRLSLGELVATGTTALPMAAGVIVVGLVVALLLGRLLGVPGRLTALLGVGTAICGASAIAAAAPGLRAKPEEIAYAVACVALFGLAATLVYPALFQWLLVDGQRVGLALGGAIHDTSQVMGAAALHAQIWPGGGTVEAATVGKLLRNLGMLAVIPLVIAVAGPAQPGGRRLPRFPLFVLGFIAMAATRTAGDALLPASTIPGWETMLNAAGELSGFLFAMAMAALGMGIQPDVLRRLGWRPAIMALSCAVLVGLTAVTVVMLTTSAG